MPVILSLLAKSSLAQAWVPPYVDKDPMIIPIDAPGCPADGVAASFNFTASSDNNLRAWVDGVEIMNPNIKGMVYTKKAHETQIFVPGNDASNKHCDGSKCTHVLSVHVKDQGDYGGFISKMFVNNQAFFTGVDPVWRSWFKRNDDSWTKYPKVDPAWKDIDFDDSSWSLHSSGCRGVPRASWTWGTSNWDTFFPCDRMSPCNGCNWRRSGSCIMEENKIVDDIRNHPARWIHANGANKCGWHGGSGAGELYFRMKFVVPQCGKSKECYDNCADRDWSSTAQGGWLNENGERCYGVTDLRCGLSTRVCSNSGTAPRQQCLDSCSGCDAFLEKWWGPIWEFYFGEGEERSENPPEGWQDPMNCPAFKWGVTWPCRGKGCKSPNNPNAPGPSGVSASSTCIPYSTPMCRDGWVPCGGGLPKCYEDGASSSEKSDACTPLSRPICPQNDGSYGSIGGTGSGRGSSNGGSSNNNPQNQESSNPQPGTSYPDPTYFPDPEDEDEEEEEDGEEADEEKEDEEEEDDDEEKEKPKKKPKKTKKPQDIARRICPTCATAQFQCREAKCDEWDCVWWCRCFEENVEYECADDGSPCDCNSPEMQHDLYNVTYDELLNSGYMDFSFTGPGSEELMERAKEAMADRPLH